MRQDCHFNPKELLRIAIKDLLLHRCRHVEQRHRRHAIADIGTALLGTERRVGGEQHMIGAVEIEAAGETDAAAAQRGIAVEILEAIEQRLAEALSTPL